jgi:hypothetical protein
MTELVFFAKKCPLQVGILALLYDRHAASVHSEGKGRNVSAVLDNRGGGVQMPGYRAGLSMTFAQSFGIIVAV